MQYYEKLKELREEKEFTQEQVAKILNISRQYYGNYENGKNEMPIRHIRTLCIFYGVSADYILDLPEGLKYIKR